MMRMATVYRKEKHLYFHASSSTTSGVWIAAPPFSMLPVDASLEEKGGAVEGALEGSREEVDHPTDFRELITPLLSLANVKSWATFSRKARCCIVEMDDKNIAFIPHDNLGSREGFEARNDMVTRLSVGALSEEVGECLDRAFDACT
ncbi:hypothetical protein LCGC14_1354210 [marine sediment metagenome]|uniref:Uncharacterized protein n=1 Tax=marine sediment metagenome TaxID=412755 RepID=A0A0F9KAM9_9ZZZZ